MAARLDVEIFAVAVGVEGAAGVGSVGHHIEILTETDALYLPVVASILFTRHSEGFGLYFPFPKHMIPPSSLEMNIHLAFIFHLFEQLFHLSSIDCSLETVNRLFHL